MDLTYIIGLSGYGRSGKDTVADFLVERHGYQRIAFADALKEAVRILDPIITHQQLPFHGLPIGLVRLSDLLKHGGMEVAKTHPEVRRLLQVMGTEVGRNLFGNDFWVEMLRHRVERMPRPYLDLRRVVITDMRFKNEAKFVENENGATVRIRRPGVGPINGHQSETDLDGWDFDYFIDNDGDLDDLAKKAATLVEMVESGKLVR